MVEELVTTGALVVSAFGRDGETVDRAADEVDSGTGDELGRSMVLVLECGVVAGASEES